MSPISATPTTRAENSNGITSMKIRRRNKVPIGCVTQVVRPWTQAASAPPA
jgi:hypothetical protein